MIEKIVAASLKKLLRINKDDEFFKKTFAKKAESEPVVSKKFEQLDKKLEKLHVFMKSKRMDQYIDLDDDDDEELELKQAIPVTYNMPKVAKYEMVILRTNPLPNLRNVPPPKNLYMVESGKTPGRV
ncbi:hypothetical protein JCGZ_19462 [Jatropha curcas]|uniref:Uncharacterized protein n=1 Tax=Jatropha curcas TaxID=180498 RepID=A0A067JZB7_JATCU|nr:hypothetical protein JCGZ_19462 [Jatropha curcas]